MKKTSMSNHVISLRCNIKCYVWGSTRNIKNPSNSIRSNCQKVHSRTKRPKTIFEIRRKSFPFKVVNMPIYYQLLKDLTNYREKTHKVVNFNERHSLEFFNSWKFRFLQTHIEKINCLFECLVRHIFSNVTRILSGLDASEQPRLVITFLAIVGHIEILHRSVVD